MLNPIKKTLVSALIIAFFIVLIVPSKSYALSCAEIKNPNEALEIYDTAVVGKVVKVKNDISQQGFTGPKEWHTYVLLEVEESWKKELPSQIIFESDYSWGFNFQENQEYLIFLYEDNGLLKHSPCSKVFNKDEGVKWFDDGMKPTKEVNVSYKMWFMFDKDIDKLIIILPIFILIAILWFRRKKK